MSHSTSSRSRPVIDITTGIGLAASIAAVGFAIWNHRKHTQKTNPADSSIITEESSSSDRHLNAEDSSIPDPNYPASLSSIEFGSLARSQLFFLRPNSVFLNHGSYGTCPVLVMKYHIRLLRRVEEHCDLWYRFHSYPMTREAIRPFANLLHCHEEDLVFVNNATSAVNAILLSLALKPGDVIITPDLTYNACKVNVIIEYIIIV